MKGDGHLTKDNSYRYVTYSYKLANDVQELALKCGFVSSICKHGDGYVVVITNGKDNRNESLLNHDGYKSITTIKYDGNIYCCEVPNHIIYVKRNGRACWSGNSRGCSWGKCAFCCQYWTIGSRVRYRSAQNIVDELAQVKEKYGISGAMFFDDEFLSNKKRLKEFCKLVKPLDIKWRCLSRVESIDDKIVPIMADAGCVEIAVGIESADQKILDNINKHIDIIKAEKACEIIKNNGIDLKELFIIGLPGESKESIQKIDEFVERTQPYDIDFTVLSVFPGSSIWNNPKNYDIKFNKECKAWYKGIPGHYESICKVSTSSLSFEELVEARNMLEKKYKPTIKLMEKL